LYIFPFLSFYIFKTEIKIHFLGGEIVEYTYGSIHFSRDDRADRSPFKFIFRAQTKQRKRNKIAYKNTKLYLGHKTVVCCFTNKKTDKQKTYKFRSRVRTKHYIMGNKQNNKKDPNVLSDFSLNMFKPVWASLTGISYCMILSM